MSTEKYCSQVSKQLYINELELLRRRGIRARGIGAAAVKEEKQACLDYQKRHGHFAPDGISIGGGSERCGIRLKSSSTDSLLVVGCDSSHCMLANAITPVAKAAESIQNRLDSIAATESHLAQAQAAFEAS